MVPSLLVLLAVAAQAPEAIVVPFPAGAHEPELAVADDGVVALVAATNNEVHVAVSQDRARSFAPPVPVGSGRVFAVGMRRGPKVALLDQALCVVVIGGEKGGGKDGDVLAFTSTDLGSTWRGPARVNSVAASAREGLHALAGGPNGTLFCAWIDLRGERPEVWGARSTDGGVTWGENRQISGPTGARVCPCCSPSAAIDRTGTVYVTWRGEDDGARDMVIVRSADAFATPAKLAQKLGHSTWKVANCPMDGGAVRAAGDDVVLAWRSSTTILTTTSHDPERETEVGNGMQPFAAVGQHSAHVVWSERRGGKLVARELGRNSKLSATRVLAPSATSGVVAGPPTRGKGPVVVAWETGHRNDSKIHVMCLED